MIRSLLLSALIIAPVLAAPATAPRIRANPAPAATPGSAPLTLDEVLRASARAAPQIVEALAKIRAAEGRAITANGAFDTVFEAEGRSRALGYYDGTVASASATSHSGVPPSALRTAMRASPPPSIVSVIFTQPEIVKSLPRSRR